MSAQPRPKPAEFHVFDTTLRDGSQQEGLNLSVADKLTIASLLDELGVGFIEGGWPGANPTDTAFFAAMADGALRLRNAELVSFGFTRRVGMKAADDPLTAALRDARAPEVGGLVEVVLDPGHHVNGVARIEAVLPQERI